MRKYFIVTITTCLLTVSQALASDALFTHCTSEWSAHAVGETFCAVAIRNGYPATAASTKRSCARAYQLGHDYFNYLDPERGVHSAVHCAHFSTRGPELLPEW